ncbi:polysaccharide pyruvyl transferase family protein [Endozoicomonas sp. GU-1]|uniref:polysaccharide pyruvyl transferase family protein n=1 Tax=Endozoicomonas sp. GU-1 TaxID=3009078 RepID=UPI0022B58CD4|nr:polysaccharide pyruvyl transferase family protein [Endozoicomonas sp. GU-1]WBA79648.1 polysaccharide pyruvyl transferase family protein [Endozoicomonas sp. GU-1]WBA87230.1 polysaccharide pyruvyl transferase family protein [Endozoicomonas sp. GU-1]
MKKLTFYLTGQKNFGNRGCEALVRSVVSLLKYKFNDVTVLVPSDNIILDQRQWPNSKEWGVEFVPFYYPDLTRWFVQFQRLPLRFVKTLNWPFPPDKNLLDAFSRVDAVISIGGDMYTYEGRLPSWIMGINDIAMNMGKPVTLWGASVSDFKEEPEFAEKLKTHFNRMSCRIVRETVSETIFKKSFLISDVNLIPDPAFILEQEEIPLDLFWPESPNNGVVGLNVSPLIEKLNKNGVDIINEISRFAKYIIEKYDLAILLIPHVSPLDGAQVNSDYHYLLKVMDKLKDKSGKISITKNDLNVSQIKYVIGKCRYFIGARMHSTVAAFSNLIPTLSIAYSNKAKGLSRDLFEDRPVVIDLSDLSCERLVSAFDYLVVHEKEITEQLSVRVPLIKNEILSKVKSVSLCV